MSKLSNKDLDRLFREGTEQYDPLDVKPEAWQQMEALLDRQRRRRLFFWWLLGLLVVVTGAGILFRQNGGDHAPDPIDAVEQTTPSRDIAAPVSPVETERPPAVVNDPVAKRSSSAGEDLSSRQEVPSPATSAATAPATAGADRFPGHSEKEKTTTPATEKTASQMAEAPKSSPPSGENADQERPLANQTTGAETRSPATVPPVLPMLAATVRMNLPLRVLPPSTTAIPAWPPPPADRLPNGALVIGLNGAPEMSAAKGSAPGPVHLRGGLTVELRYARHFSVSTGVLFSNKKYSAGKGAYTPPKGFWTYKIAPTSTDAECTVLEVPLNVGYFLHHHSASTFFFEAGLSNFFMLEEHYHYFYDDPTPGLVKYWGAENENRHYLAILNIAPGYQWQPRQWLGLQISPYAQIPVAGVGHGKVALYSFGVNLRVNLTPWHWQ